MARKTQLIDKAHWLVTTGISVGFFVCLFIFLIVGAAGPDPVENFLPKINENLSNYTCSDPKDCTVTVSAVMDGVTGYNQAIWLTAGISRPFDSSTQRPALLGANINWDQVVSLDMYGVDTDNVVTALATNKTYVAKMMCKSGEVDCIPSLIFIQNYITFASYKITARFDSPHKAFVDAGLNPSFVSNNVKLALIAGKVGESYTHWMIGSKYFFFTISLIMFIIYCYYLLKGPGSLDPRQKQATLADVVSTVTGAQGSAKVDAAIQLAKGIPGRLPMTWNQSWVVALSFFLILFNDPFFVVGLASPNLSYQGFYAVCAVTFLALLLLYWLVSFDKARSEFGINDESVSGVTSRLSRICNMSAIASAFCFWMPKIILILILWVTSLSLYMWQKYQQIADPTYQITEAFQGLGGSASKYFFNFMATIAAFYVIYLVVLMFMGFSPQSMRGMKPSSRYVLLITVFSILLILIAVFLGGFSAQRQSSALFMLVYGAVNCYLWFLQIALLPLYPPTAEDLSAEVKNEGRLELRSDSVDGVRMYNRPEMYDAGTQTGNDDFSYDIDNNNNNNGSSWSNMANEQQKQRRNNTAAVPAYKSTNAPNPFNNTNTAPGFVDDNVTNNNNNLMLEDENNAFDAIVPVSNNGNNRRLNEMDDNNINNNDDNDLQQWN